MAKNNYIPVADILKQKEYYIKLLLQYLQSDTILYWSDNPKLKSIQQTVWLPYILWFQKQTGVEVVYSSDIINKDNNVKNAQKFLEYLTELDEKIFCALLCCAQELRSVILALSLCNNFANEEQVVNASFLEQKFQESLWGEDCLSTNQYSQSAEKLVSIKKYFQK